MPDGIAIEQGLPLVVLKRQSTRYLECPDGSANHEPDFSGSIDWSLSRMPLIVKGECLGVLFYTKEEHRFAAEEMNFLRSRQSSGNRDLQSHLFEQTQNQASNSRNQTRSKMNFWGHVMSLERRSMSS
jgi:hypothetical protein